MNNGIKMTVKILVVVMLPKFTKIGWGVIIECYEG